MKRQFMYQVYEGTARQVGQEQARRLKKAWPQAANFFGSPFEGKKERLAEAEDLLGMTARWCPGLNEEIEGFASELGVSPESVVWYTATIPRSSNCSQFAVLPDRSSTGGVLCARSYEWSLEDELTLKTARVAGAYAHTGFSVFTFGRLDGLNEKGLWVSMTAGNPGPNMPQTRGFRFWALVRAILDRAATVDEAVRIASSFPLAFEVILLVAEPGGKAAIIEKGPDYQAVRTEEKGVVFSTNHLALPGTRDRQPAVMDHSLRRTKYLERVLAEGSLSLADVERILSSPFPDGLVARFYSEYFGTLWSSYADLSSGVLRVCFGPPDAPGRSYREFSPRDPVGSTAFEAELPDVKAPEGTWITVPRPADP